LWTKSFPPHPPSKKLKKIKGNALYIFAAGQAICVCQVGQGPHKDNRSTAIEQNRNKPTKKISKSFWKSRNLFSKRFLVGIQGATPLGRRRQSKGGTP
jgi:hypothetical protein